MRLSAAGAAIGLTERSRGGRPTSRWPSWGASRSATGRFSSWPVITESDERAWMEVLARRALVPARRRLRQPVRGDLGQDARRQALRGRRQWHECADHVAGRARDRARRRGDRAPLYVRRHDQRRLDAPRAAGLRGYRPRDVSDRRPQDRSGDHRTDGLHHAGPPRRLGGRHGHDPGRRRASTSCRSSKTPARPTWPSGGTRRSARSATSAASASRRPRTSIPAKAGRSSPTATICSSSARAFRTTAGRRPTPGSRTFATAPTCGSPSSRPRSYCSSSPGSRNSPAAASRTRPTSRSSSRRSPASRPPRCTMAARAMPIISTCSVMIPTISRSLPRSRFLEALAAEGIPCSGGYQPLYKEPFLRNTLQSRAFQAIYAPKRISEYFEQIQCPGQRTALRDGSSG